jgi:hypothetical protein
MPTEVLSMDVPISKLPEGRLRRKYEAIRDALGPDVRFIRCYGRILWFVPGQEQARILMERLGYRRSAIWTWTEARDLLEAGGYGITSLEAAAQWFAEGEASEDWL